MTTDQGPAHPPRITNEPADRVAKLEPAPGSTIERTREDAGWTIIGRWWGQAGEPASDGPREVVIRLAEDAAPDVRQRGINSGVMRRMERHVNNMAAEVHEVLGVGAYQVMVRRYLENRVAELPESPRKGGDAYYRGLLDIFDDLTSRGHPEPLNVLASVMQIPKDTLKTRLRIARQRREMADESSR